MHHPWVVFCLLCIFEVGANSYSMKILKIYIQGHRQFKDVEIDLTHPETGEGLDKICFIGSNGTGKSTLLELIRDLMWNKFDERDYSFFFNVALKIKYDGVQLYWMNKFIHTGRARHWHKTFLSSDIEKNANWFREFCQLTENDFKSIARNEVKVLEEKYNVFTSEILKSVGLNQVLVHSPSELNYLAHLKPGGLPESNVSQALALFDDFPYYHHVSGETLNEFWRNLIYISKLREENRNEFENRPENLDKTKKELISEFDSANPKPLDKLAVVWNGILKKAWLEFNADKAQNPVQLSDNLAAYINHIGTDQNISYDQLSTGIRNFIFRIGHIYSLFFSREVKKAIVLMDEPENSLFPDFLYDLIETYQSVFEDKNKENNAQFFVATHSPIIAAQFEPYERIVLEWDGPGSVKAHKGKAPAGDDPNDILRKDFGIVNLMGKEGQKKWKEYIGDLKQLRRTDDPKMKKDLIEKIQKIGADYNFTDEIPV